jgi:hypothetical protein
MLSPLCMYKTGQGDIMTNINIKVEPMDDDADKAALYHYTLSGLNNYWLTPELYEIGEYEGEETIRFVDLDDVHVAIGMHICEMRRPLGPREIRFLRGELGYSQTQLGHALGYKDKQTVLKAERVNDKREPLATPADLYLRALYLGMLVQRPLIGGGGGQDALELSQAVARPIHAVDDMDYRIAA